MITMTSYGDGNSKRAAAFRTVMWKAYDTPIYEVAKRLSREASNILKDDDFTPRLCIIRIDNLLAGDSSEQR